MIARRPDLSRALNRVRPGIAVLVGVLATLFAFAVYVYYKAALRVEITSDQASFVLAARDILRGNWNLSGWTMSHLSYWSSDVLLCLAAVELFGVQPVVLRVVPAVIYALTVACCIWLAVRQERGRKALVVGIAAFVLAGLPSEQTSTMLNTVLMGGYHVGTLLLGLLSLGLIRESLSAFEGPDRVGCRWQAFMAAATLAFAMALAGDDLAIYAFLIPIGVWLLLSWLRKDASQRILMVAVWAGASFCLAHLTLAVIHATGGFSLVPLPPHFVGWALLGKQVEITVVGLLSLFGADFFGRPVLALPTATILAHTIALLFVFWAIARTLLRWWKGAENDDWVESVLALGFLLQLLAFTLSTRGSADSGTVRYLLALPIFGSVIAARRLANVVVSNKRQVVALVLVVCFVALSAVASFGAVFRHDPYKLEADELATWLTAHDLRYGFGGFWDASLVTVESGGAVSVRSVIEQDGYLSPWRWLSKGSWYDPSQCVGVESLHEEGCQEAVFVVWRSVPGPRTNFGVNIESAVRTFGEPSERYQVGPYQVLVWRHDLRPYLRPGVQPSVS